ncbi:substrate-binding periplasmic protein [Pseudaeromonas sharmana]|uniref:Substrate-binding periplasmic protein n=1 Tax=Pseudaeromonas sharmana TaxID=328412 RepID=A0ABV8CRL9_9GAMM
MTNNAFSTIRRLLLASSLLCCALSTQAADTVLVATLEWPPYIGSQLPGQGPLAQQSRQIFARMGLQQQLEFLPWRRALRAMDEPGPHLAIMPEYNTQQRQQALFCSQPFARATLSLVQNTQLPPIRWRALTDLAPYTIGTVSGYVHTDEFDQLLAAGRLKHEEAPSDLLNLRKVAAGRLPLAVIDPLVYHALIQQDPSLRAMAGNIRLLPHPIGEQGLVICFRRTPQGAKLRDAFNVALRQHPPVLD